MSDTHLINWFILKIVFTFMHLTGAFYPNWLSVFKPYIWPVPVLFFLCWCPFKNIQAGLIFLHQCKDVLSCICDKILFGALWTLEASQSPAELFLSTSEYHIWLSSLLNRYICATLKNMILTNLMKWWTVVSRNRNMLSLLKHLMMMN